MYYSDNMRNSDIDSLEKACQLLFEKSAFIKELSSEDISESAPSHTKIAHSNLKKAAPLLDDSYKTLQLAIGCLRTSLIFCD